MSSSTGSRRRTTHSEHVGDYEEWLTRFEAKLQALPEDKRHMTSLDVLESLRQPLVAQHPAAGSPHFDEALQTLDIGPETRSSPTTTSTNSSTTCLT